MRRGLSGGSCRDTREYSQEFVKCIVCDRLYPVLTTDGGKNFICDQHKQLDPEAYHITRLVAPDAPIEEIESLALGLYEVMEKSMADLKAVNPDGLTPEMEEEFRETFVERAMKFFAEKGKA